MKVCRPWRLRSTPFRSSHSDSLVGKAVLAAYQELARLGATQVHRAGHRRAVHAAQVLALKGEEEGNASIPFQSNLVLPDYGITAGRVAGLPVLMQVGWPNPPALIPVPP